MLVPMGKTRLPRDMMIAIDSLGCVGRLKESFGVIGAIPIYQ